VRGTRSAASSVALAITLGGSLGLAPVPTNAGNSPTAGHVRPFSFAPHGSDPVLSGRSTGLTKQPQAAAAMYALAPASVRTSR